MKRMINANGIIYTVALGLMTAFCHGILAADDLGQSAKPLPTAPTGTPPEIALDADAEKVRVISDLESADEIFNGQPGRETEKSRKLESGKPVWIGRAGAKYGCNFLERAKEHVLHGTYSVKAHVDTNSVRAWMFTANDSCLADWTGYDAIRFHAYSPETKPMQWALIVRQRFTDDPAPQGKAGSGNAVPARKAEFLGVLFFDVQPGESDIEIPLLAFDDPDWHESPGCTNGANVSASRHPTEYGCVCIPRLWGYAYMHKHGWQFNEVVQVYVGLRGGYDPSVPHDYWVDYLRLVKKRSGAVANPDKR